MRRSGCVLGIVLLLAGATVSLMELAALFRAEDSPLTLGTMWYRVHANSLVGFQALIEQGLSPAIWSPIQFVLTIRLWWLLIPPGLVLLLACRTRSRQD